jgi:hypothetical protein
MMKIGLDTRSASFDILKAEQLSANMKKEEGADAEEDVQEYVTNIL